MSTKVMKPLSVAVGVAFVGSLAIAQAATASDFSMVDLNAGYQLAGDPAAAAEGKCGEGKCGDKMFDAMDADKNGLVSKAECDAHHDAMFKKMDANADGNISREESKAMHEGKCGEGKCGEGKAGEGKCGEGKCGEDKK